jgi:signal transduction histidine kinase
LIDYEQLLGDVRQNAWPCDKTDTVIKTMQRIDCEYLIDEVPRAVEQALEGVSRVSALVSAMKEFSHPGAKEKTPTDLNHAIASTITVARNEWKYVADMETDFDSSILPVPCLAGEFNQVILNLIVNSAHAIGDATRLNGSVRGLIRIQTRNSPPWVEIQVQDSGSGIPESILGRIFDPFFTTKEVGKGTGQGLAIARSVIVDKHGGTIDVESKLGRGTTFTIRLPQSGRESNSKDATP